MQRTLNRELKELEIAGREAIATCEERRPDRGLFNGANHPIGDSVIASGRGGVTLPPAGFTLSQLGRPAGIS
jgi:hypothetical protein